MRRLLFLALAALIAAPAAAADLPPFVMHVKPVGPLLDDLRAGAKAVGGPGLVQQFNDTLKQSLGEKGFAGVDTTRPIVGYARMPEKDASSEDLPFVLIVPVTSEEAFLELTARSNDGKGKATPIAGKPGLYRLGKDENDAPAGKMSVMRFHQTYAYITTEKNAAALDATAIVPAEKLAMPGETAILAMKIYFDRFPEELRTKIASEFDKGLKSLKDSPVPDDLKNRVLNEKVKQLSEQMVTRLGDQIKDASSATARMVFDTKTAELGIEVALAAKPGTNLAKDIADRKPNTNQFAGLVGKDTTGGVLLTVPLFAKEIREIFAMGFEEGAKENKDIPEFAQPALKELSAGVGRTMRSGNLDLALALNGPDKKGQFTAIGAISFDDPSKLEKELRTLLNEQAPVEVRNMVTLDAAKAGGANIHLVKVPADQLPPQAKAVFGDSPAVAIAFAPKGVYLAFGPDPVAALKTAVVTQPGEARVLDVMINPAKLGKLAAAIDENGESAKKLADVIGDKDELYSILFVAVEGGTELRARIGVNVKLISGAVMQSQVLPGASK